MIQKKPIAQQNTSLVNRIASHLNSQSVLEKGSGIIVAVSGGSDSIALLHILHSINFSLQLTAVYIDHGLRPMEIPHEKDTIKNCCQALGIPFLSKTVNVKKFATDKKHSIEEAARILRYKKLEDIRQSSQAAAIAVGHTSDDQIEEFFIRIIRGGGRKSLSGMDFSSGKILRPLLYESKNTLTTYLSQKNISWCVDSSNLERKFLRNRIRLDLLPFLEQKFNPSIRKTVLNTLDILTKEESFLEEKTEKAFARCVIGSNQKNSPEHPRIEIDIEAFRRHHPAIRARILEKTCWAMVLRPTYQQINALSKLIDNPANNKQLHLSNGVRAEKTNHSLILSMPLKKGRLQGSAKSLAIIQLEIPGPGTYDIIEQEKSLTLVEVSLLSEKHPNEKLLRVDREKISFPLSLRSFSPGERFHPYGAPGTRKISRYLSDQKIPARTRNSIPVLLSAGKIIALPGMQIDHNVRIVETTHTILTIAWQDHSKK